MSYAYKARVCCIGSLAVYAHNILLVFLWSDQPLNWQRRRIHISSKLQRWCACSIQLCPSSTGCHQSSNHSQISRNTVRSSIVCNHSTSQWTSPTGLVPSERCTQPSWLVPCYSYLCDSLWTWLEGFVFFDNVYAVLTCADDHVNVNSTPPYLSVDWLLIV